MSAIAIPNLLHTDAMRFDDRGFPGAAALVDAGDSSAHTLQPLA